MNYYNYFTEIEETFVRRRGKHLFLSPLDWALIEAWQERGVPLYIVIRSIESVFDVYDQQPPGTRTIKSLFYCRDEIEASYAEWLKSRAGASSGDGGTNNEVKAGLSVEWVKAHIADRVGKLRANSTAALQEDIRRAVVRLEELAAAIESHAPETVDQTLGDIERMLERSLVANWDADRLKAIKREVTSQLREYKHEMDPGSYKTTFDLMLMKRVREEADIPRLGLFYL